MFNGKVIVAEGAQQTDSNQSNKNLLSLESNAFSNPQLEIYADDVSCGHGSTTGADENSISTYVPEVLIIHLLKKY